MKRQRQFGVSLVVGATLLGLVLSQFDLVETAHAVGRADASLVMEGLGLMAAAYALRGVRWRVWERSLSYWDSVRLILIGFMGNNVMPARSGEFLRAQCAALKTGQERGWTPFLASVAAERALDGLLLGTLGVASALLVRVDWRLSAVLFVVSATLAGSTAGVIVGVRMHARIRQLLQTAHDLFPGHLTRFARDRANHFLDGLVALGTRAELVGAAGLTALVWGLELAFYSLLCRSIAAAFPATTALLFLAVVNLASLFPLTVGGIGAIEAAATTYLISAGVPAPLALAVVLMQHAAQFLFTTVLGALFYFTGHFSKAPSAGAEPAEEAAVLDAPSGASLLWGTREQIDQLGRMIPLEPVVSRHVLLSVVIPAYNEQYRLPRTLLQALRWCNQRTVEFELIVADDGSRDQTLALARLFEEQDRHVRPLACPHRGKGAAVRMGMLNARGQYVLFMDADGATPLDEIPKLVEALDRGYDVAIGSRVPQAPDQVRVVAHWHRRLVGRTFAFLVNVLAVPGMADTQCGFKMFRREVVGPIFSRQRFDHFAFDVEILFLAKRLGLSVAEIPVNWTDQPGSKVNLVTDSIRMLWDIAHVRWLHHGPFEQR
jgi:dolichyl-phosphate beta-glucosyltransferase